MLILSTNDFFIFKVLEDPYVKCLTEKLAQHMQVIITESLLCVCHYAKCFSLYFHSINVNIFLFSLLMDRLGPKPFLCKLSWAVEKIYFHEGKDTVLYGLQGSIIFLALEETQVHIRSMEGKLS